MLVLILVLFVMALVINTFKENQYIGQPVLTAPNTIAVTGTGDVVAVPDTAEFSFSVTADAPAMTDAQNIASTKTNAIITAVKALGVADADIQTTDYSANPTYTYTRTACPLDGTVSGSSGGGDQAPGSPVAQPMIVYSPCTNENQKLTGYEVTETLSVKVRSTGNAGTVLAKVTSLGATNVSGLTFVVDNPDTVQQQAEAKAIADAQSKAQVLAKSLGVKLTKIVNFSENGNQPVYYPMALSANSSAGTASVTPNIQTGTNKITSNVTITYEVD